MDQQTKQKTLKILNIVVNVIVGLVLVVALLVTINSLSSNKKGYTSLFGTAFLVVQTDSMDGDTPEFAKELGKPGGFAPKDLVVMHELKESEKESLEVGDIISYFVDRSGQRVLDSHRIVEINETENGIEYITQGDNVDKYEGRTDRVTAHQGNSQYYYVVGRVDKNLGKVGAVFDFFQSSTGFLVCIVVPSFLVAAYFAFNLIWEIVKVRKAGAAANADSQKAQMKEELLAELRAQGLLNQPEVVAPDSSADSGEKPAETSETENNTSETESKE